MKLGETNILFWFIDRASPMILSIPRHALLPPPREERANIHRAGHSSPSSMHLLRLPSFSFGFFFAVFLVTRLLVVPLLCTTTFSLENNNTYRTQDVPPLFSMPLRSRLEAEAKPTRFA